jgi:hypothetical protein
VTEGEWLACENPNHALYLLRMVGNRSRRKDRLAAAAGLRHFWADLSTEQWLAITAAESYAGGEIRFPELRAAAVRVGSGAGGTLRGAVARVTHREVADALWNVTVLFLPVVVGGPVYTNPPFPEARAYAERGRPMMAILRCIFGNPFRPASLSPAVLAWNDATVVRLGQAAYDERHMPEGSLDNGRLAVLADALEEAGCSDADILDHLRGPGPHVRGCWVVDLLLGKE